MALIRIAIICLTAILRTVSSALFVRPILSTSKILRNDLRPRLTESPKEGKSDIMETIRVRIWRALADGEELSLTQLSKIVGEGRLGELRSHLTHVERQAKTLGNKSNEWRLRRGLVPIEDDFSVQRKRLRIKMRKGKKNELFIRLG
jgi:hypothetical protein